MISYQSETWADFNPDGQKLFPLHWKELAVNQDKFSHAMDDPRYAKLSDMGMLHISTARDDGKLIGYIVTFIITHMHYCNAGQFALTDMYYVLPEYRHGCGVKLFAFMESCLRKLGIVQAHTSCKVHQDHTAMLEALGWKFTDKTFTKYLGDK